MHRFAFGPLGQLVLGLNQPFVPLHLGLTDAEGAASRTLTLPSSNIPMLELYAQGFTVDFSLTPPGPPSFDFCTSDVVGFRFGGK